MNIPAFSLFSAISELIVTAAVLYTIVGNLRGRPFQWRLLGLVLAFELCVNIVYMSIRAAHADTTAELTRLMTALYAAHGIMSLLMFVGLLLVFMLAVIDEKSGRATWFRRHAALTYSFLLLWMISVASGEVIFVLRYLLPAMSA